MIYYLLSIQSFMGSLAGGETWNDIWLPLTLLAVFTVFVFYLVFYMIGRSFDIPELERNSKAELLQTFATAFIAVFLVLLVNGAVGLSATVLAIGAGEDVEGGYTEEATVLLVCEEEMYSADINSEFGMDQIIDGIRCRIKERSLQVDSAQRRATTGSDTMNLFNFRNFGISLVGIPIFQGAWDGDTFRATEERRIINNLATVMLISLNAQSFFLTYVKANMIHIFLPMGILLRSFKFTRGVGAMFISLAIGLYFVFPVIYVLLDPGFVGVEVPDEAEGGMDITEYCYPTMGTATTMYTAVQQSAASLGATGLELASLRSALSTAYTSLIIHPLVALSLTLVIVRYIMTVLGGDPYALVKLVTKVI